MCPKSLRDLARSVVFENEASALGPLATILGLVFCSMTFVWLTGYAFAVAKAGGVLRRPRVRRALDRVTGAVLVAFGLRLAAESR